MQAAIEPFLGIQNTSLQLQRSELNLWSAIQSWLSCCVDTTRFITSRGTASGSWQRLLAIGDGLVQRDVWEHLLTFMNTWHEKYTSSTRRYCMAPVGFMVSSSRMAFLPSSSFATPAEEVWSYTDCFSTPCLWSVCFSMSRNSLFARLKAQAPISLTCNSKYVICVYDYHTFTSHTSSTARGGGGSFKHRKRIGEIACCKSRMTKH